MGRTFLSVRQGAKIIAERWERVARRTRPKHAKRMYEIAKSYSSEGFMGCNAPMESVLFSACVELLKEQGQGRPVNRPGPPPTPAGAGGDP